MTEQIWQFSGVNAVTGGYSVPGLTSRALDKVIRTGVLPPAQSAHWGDLQLRLKWRNAQHKGTREGVAADDLGSAGWGVIFPEPVDPAIVEALDPLLLLRQRQSGEFFQYYHGPEDAGGGYRPGESKSQFLARNGVGPGPVSPERMPYYLLLVGGPEQIPFDFQYQLDIQYAVGRLHFDTPEEYAAYAALVVAQESPPALPTVRPSAGGGTLFWAPANPDDEPTRQTLRNLMEPLATRDAGRGSLGAVRPPLLRRDATKANLLAALTTDPPQLLVTAGHGVELPAGDPRQRRLQGALLGQEWPGPLMGANLPLTADQYLAAEDLGSNVAVPGLIAFCLACFGGGTPAEDEFPEVRTGRRRQLAPAPFVAALPTQLLRRGALAVISHVERAWNYSFSWPDAGPQRAVFESALDAMQAGKPVGLAMEYFNERYAEIAAELNAKLDEIRGRKKHEPAQLIQLWTAANDARSYAVLGDPAVRLARRVPSRSLEGAPVVVNSAPAPPAGEVTAPPGQRTVRTWVGEPGSGERMVAAESRILSDGSVATAVGPAFAGNEPLLIFHRELVVRALQAWARHDGSAITVDESSFA